VQDALSGTVYWRRSGGRLRVTGKTLGRYIFVVLKPSTAWPGWHEIVTARPAKKWEKQLFARRRKGSI
jgi:hypothetical protein